MWCSVMVPALMADDLAQKNFHDVLLSMKVQIPATLVIPALDCETSFIHLCGNGTNKACCCLPGSLLFGPLSRRWGAAVPFYNSYNFPMHLVLDADWNRECETSGNFKMATVARWWLAAITSHPTDVQ